MKEKELFTTIKPEICLAQLFQSRDIMHLAHLQTTSYATHKALQKYYEGILELTDDLIESYMGTLNKRVNLKIPASEYVNPESHLKYLKEYMMKHRGVFGKDNSHIQNIVDEIIALITKTQYLLTLQ